MPSGPTHSYTISFIQGIKADRTAREGEPINATTMKVDGRKEKDTTPKNGDPPFAGVPVVHLNTRTLVGP